MIGCKYCNETSGINDRSHQCGVGVHDMVSKRFWVCTRAKLHEGNHVACGAFQCNYLTWHNTVPQDAQLYADRIVPHEY